MSTIDGKEDKKNTLKEETIKTGKFSFSLSSKISISQPKPEPDSIQSSQPRPDPASLLATLKAEKVTNKSDDETKSETSSSLKPVKAIKMKLATNIHKQLAGIKRPAQEPKKIDLAEVFNPDEQPEEEEMPPEAKMRMRNIGKDTPTASGPNSFNKGKLGFCNQAKMLEKQLKLACEAFDNSKRKF